MADGSFVARALHIGKSCAASAGLSVDASGGRHERAMVRITGAKAHKARLSRIRGEAMVREVGKAIYAAADYLSTEAALSITAGAVSGKGHVPSAPGEPPNEDTGTLSRSIRVDKTGPLTAETSANAPYAVPLEFGTSKMAARPFMQPAAAKTRKPAERLVQAAVKRVVKGGTL